MGSRWGWDPRRNHGHALLNHDHDGGGVMGTAVGSSWAAGTHAANAAMSASSQKISGRSTCLSRASDCQTARFH